MKESCSDPVGILCEYNPFHRGHAHQLQEIRETTDAPIICVMSGRFVQRGEPALCDPLLRAEMAIEAGADLVLELPFPWCAASAAFFARAGISILARLGVKRLAFGSETADTLGTDYLPSLADQIDTIPSSVSGHPLHGSGSFFEALEKVLKDKPPLSSNDLLGLAYLRVLKREFKQIQPIILQRVGTAYRSTDPVSDRIFPSAASLRHAILSENPWQDGMPPIAAELLQSAILRGEAPINARALDNFFLNFLRMSDPDGLSDYAECGGGLAQRLVKLSRQVGSLDQLYREAASKTYTDTHIRRAILFAATGVTMTDLDCLPAYTTLLGVGKTGRQYLSALRKQDSAISIVTKSADRTATAHKNTRQTLLGLKADALAAAAHPVPLAPAEFLRQSPFVKK